MKKTILIIAGISIPLLALIVWGVLFIFSPSAGGGGFANFGFGGEVPETEPNQTTSTVNTLPTVPENSGRQTLQQLTTRPVAGMGFVGTTTILYAEQGTGYVYKIDIASGEEVQVSNRTFAKVREAEFSSDGEHVVLSYTGQSGQRVFVGTFTGETLEGSTLLAGAHSPHFSSATTTPAELWYLLETDSGTEGYAYDAEAGTNSQLFRVPFSAARISWGPPHYIYTRPTGELLGYVYTVDEDVVSYAASGGYGLTAVGFLGGFIKTIVVDGEPVSAAIIDGAEYTQPLALLPEKCTPVTKERDADLLCAAPSTLPTFNTYPDDWYKGVASFRDKLWSIQADQQRVTLLADPLAETGRELDVLRITGNIDASQFLLINKNDNTLWLFDPNGINS